MGKKVVVVDASDTRRRVAEIFRAAGWEVVTAADANEGLEVIRQAEPTCVVVDASGEWGLGVLEIEKAFPDLPIVLITDKGGTCRCCGNRRPPFNPSRVLALAERIVQERDDDVEERVYELGPE